MNDSSDLNSLFQRHSSYFLVCRLWIFSLSRPITFVFHLTHLSLFHLVFCVILSYFCTTCIAYGAGSMKQYGVCLSICPSICPSEDLQLQMRSKQEIAIDCSSSGVWRANVSSAALSDLYIFIPRNHDLLTFDTFAATFQSTDVSINAWLALQLVFGQVTANIPSHSTTHWTGWLHTHEQVVHYMAKIV